MNELVAQVDWEIGNPFIIINDRTIRKMFHDNPCLKNCRKVCKGGYVSYKQLSLSRAEKKIFLLFQGELISYFFLEKTALSFIKKLSKKPWCAKKIIFRQHQVTLGRYSTEILFDDELVSWIKTTNYINESYKKERTREILNILLSECSKETEENKKIKEHQDEIYKARKQN